MWRAVERQMEVPSEMTHRDVPRHEGSIRPEKKWTLTVEKSVIVAAGARGGWKGGSTLDGGDVARAPSGS